MHLPRTVLTIALAATTATALPSFRSKQPTKDDVKCDGTTCSHNGRYEQPSGRQEMRIERDGGGSVSSPWKDDEGYPKSNRVVGDREHPNGLYSGEREGGQTLVTGDENSRPGHDQVQSSSGGKGGAPLTVARSYPSRNPEGEFGDVVNSHQGHSNTQQDYQGKRGGGGGARADLVKGSLRGNPDDFRSVNPDDFHSGSLGGKTNPDDFQSGGKGGSPVLGARNFHNRGPKQRMDFERKGGAPHDVNGNFHSHGPNDFETQPAHNHLQTRQAKTGPTSNYQPGQTEDCVGSFCSQKGWTSGSDGLYVGNNHGHGNTQDFVPVRGNNGVGNTQDFVPVRGNNGVGNTQDFLPVRGNNGVGNTQDDVGGKNGEGYTKQDWIGQGKTQDFVGGKNGEGYTKQDWVGQGNTQDFVGGKNGEGVTKQDWIHLGSSPLQTRQSSGLGDLKSVPFTGPQDLAKRPGCFELASNPGFRGANGDLTC